MPEPGADALVLALDAQKAGAGRTVAGLTVLGRLLKQLTHLGRKRIVVASDGTCPLPAGVTVREVPTPAALDALRDELGRPPEYSADVVHPRNSDLGIAHRVVDEDSRRLAEDAIFAELKRGDLGLVARYLNKPISFWITRHLLCGTRLTPNQVTLGAAAVGLVGVALVAGGGYAGILAGFFLLHVQSVLDGCDGELARVRYQQSPIGAWLDTVVDDGLNFTLFVGLAIGVGGGYPAGPWRLLGLASAAGMLFYTVVAYRELRRQAEGGEVLNIRWWFNKGKNMKERFDRWGVGELGMKDVLHAAGRRDFFLAACVVLAAFGLHRAILLYAAALAATSAVGAAGQLLLVRPGVKQQP